MDAGALIAVERGERRVRVLLDETERAGWSLVVPVGPLAEAAAQEIDDLRRNAAAR